ncbi:MAG: hypothetical protein EBX41_01685 [Chitinophagia bacterium]|nr:hypothetical protein [Chitinophagia bacterium]
MRAIDCKGLLRLFFTLLLLSIAGRVGAQRFAFYNLSVNEGLMQSQAQCLTQDIHGNIWIGTLGGLSRYDGYAFTNYTLKDGLLSLSINALATDTAGNVWISTPNALSRFNGKYYKHFVPSHPSALTGSNRQQIIIHKDSVWWRTGGEVYFITNNRLNRFATPGKEKPVTAMACSKTAIYIAQEGKVYVNTNDKWDSLQFDLLPDQPRPAINKLFIDKDGTLWVATHTGLFRATGTTLTTVIINGIATDNIPINDLAQDDLGSIWAATNKGAFKIEKNNIIHYFKKNGLSDNRINSLLKDAEGNMWLATDGQGVFRFLGDEFNFLDETMWLYSGQVMGIASNKRDSLFLGTIDAGIFIFTTGKVVRLPLPQEAGNTITSVCYTANGKLWMGTRSYGLWEYDHDIYRQFQAPLRKFPTNYITALYEAPDRRMWIGFDNGVMWRAQDTFYRIKMPENQGAVQAFLQLNNDSVLIATDKKLFIYTTDTVLPFITNTLIDSSHIQCMLYHKGYLWLGCHENGILRYSRTTGSVVKIDKQNGLRSNFIYNLIADNEQNIWAGTGYGIHKIGLNTDSVNVTFIGKGNGLAGMESNSNAVLKMPDGSIWFGTTNGAVHYIPQPDSISKNRYAIQVKLTNIKLIGEDSISNAYTDSFDYWTGIPFNLKLPFKKNNISFSFHAHTFNKADQALYRYHVEGLETPWSDWSQTTTITFNALPPGTYTLVVECSLPNVKTVVPLRYTFTIITPFHKTPLFKVLLLVGALLLGILLQYGYTRRKNHRQKLRTKLRAEEQAKIRLRTAEDFHDEIGNKLTRINVLANILKSKVGYNDDAQRIINQIEENTIQLYGGTRDILWSLQPSNDNLYEILMRIKEFGEELLQDTDIEYTFTGIDTRWRTLTLNMDASRNLLMIFKEALNNALKYANASQITMHASLKGRDILNIVLRDNGAGFDQATPRKGNGISNMNVRANRLNGRIYVDSQVGKGTVVSLTFKIPRKKG